MTYKTEQESFWAGTFGDEYVERNKSQALLASNLAFWSRILAQYGPVQSALELGANIGMNLMALDLLFPGIRMEGAEINEGAAAQLASWGKAKVFKGSIFNYDVQEQFDLVFTKGVMIHLSPDCLTQVYDLMEKASSRLVCIAEYYNPSPVEILYRGHPGKLFKRDFAGEMLERHSNLRLLDYGFVYKRDPAFPQDDITWFLLGKR
ncbi:MAG: pseudaminic acid biosynthesis-associated methylase [Clostridia bacterium]|nr:pseudaminic acid biosynthesis-associated methylase [Clostridia bacterium]